MAAPAKLGRHLGFGLNIRPVALDNDQHMAASWLPGGRPIEFDRHDRRRLGLLRLGPGLSLAVLRCRRHRQATRHEECEKPSQRNARERPCSHTACCHNRPTAHCHDKAPPSRVYPLVVFRVYGDLWGIQPKIDYVVEMRARLAVPATASPGSNRPTSGEAISRQKGAAMARKSGAGPYRSRLFWWAAPDSSFGEEARDSCAWIRSPNARHLAAASSNSWRAGCGGFFAASASHCLAIAWHSAEVAIAFSGCRRLPSPQRRPHTSWSLTQA